MSIYRFNDSGTATDAMQNDAHVKFGDTLVVMSEGIVGVACLNPFTVSAAKGDFYDFTWDEPVSDPNVLLTLVNSIRAAVAEAERLGIPINPAFSGFTQRR